MSEKRFSDLNDLQAIIEELEQKIDEQQATIEQLRQSQDVKEFSALFNQSIALQREIKDLKEENIELKKLRKYCAEWIGVNEDNLYDVVR